MADPYFQNFPVIKYDLTGAPGASGKQNFFIRDMFRTFRIRPEIVSNRAAFYKFDIRDWDTPENLSNKIYGSPHLFWLFYQMNLISDPWWDWPLNQRQFELFLIDKYSGSALMVNPGPVSEFAVGDTITGATSAATGTIVSIDKTNFNIASQVIPQYKYVITNTNTAEFVSSEIIASALNTATVVRTFTDANSSADHHYEDNSTDRNQVDAITAGAVVVDNIEFELRINDAKRSIKILKPEFVPEVIEQFNAILAQ